jgi:ATP-dependent helicase/nuclease subunit B
LQTHPAAAWPALLDVPAAAPQAALPPRPCPPLGARPRQLAVTDIAALLRNPYEVYARRILRLKALEPLEQSTDFMDYGNIVHRGLDEFLRDVGIGWPDDAVPRIAQAMQNALRSASVREALIAWWSPRLGRIAEWVDGEERRRRDASPPVAVETEIEGRWTLVTAGEAFTLVGRADRIERRRDGRIAILDYKTGAVPTRKDAEEGRAPQLLLEAAMARAGAFGPDFAGGTSELVYWRLSGDHDKGKAVRLLKDATDDGIDLAVADAGDQLRMLIESYDDPRSCYPAQPLPAHPRHDPYAQLSRAAEWGAAEETGETMEGAEP